MLYHVVWCCMIMIDHVWSCMIMYADDWWWLWMGVDLSMFAVSPFWPNSPCNFCFLPTMAHNLWTAYSAIDPWAHDGEDMAVNFNPWTDPWQTGDGFEDTDSDDDQWTLSEPECEPSPSFQMNDQESDCCATVGSDTGHDSSEGKTWVWLYNRWNLLLDHQLESIGQHLEGFEQWEYFEY